MKIKELLKELISIKSYSGDEKEIALFIKQYFLNKNISVIEQEGNIIVHIKNNSKKAIIFNAHMDTVSVQDPDKWETNPFKLIEKDEKYFGLGTSDEKISIAILMDMIDDLLNLKADIDIFLVFVVMEEIDGSGSENFVKYFLENYDYDKTHCIICEPRDAKFLGMGNKGNIFFEINTEGKAVHSSKPLEGENAILKMFEIVKRLTEELPNYSKTCEKLGPATLAFPTMIQGGNSVNTIPDKCTAKGDIRTNTLCHKQILEFLKHFKVKIISSPEPYILDENDELVKVFESLGIKDKTYTTGSNDAVFFGQAGIPSVVFGAGTEKMCHKANEYVKIENIEKTKKIYIAVIKELSA